MKKKGLNLSATEAKGMTIRQRAIHYFWGDNAGHPAFRHALSVHAVRKLANEGDRGRKRTAMHLMKEHKVFREAIEAMIDAIAKGEAAFLEVVADATRRLKSPAPVDAVRWEAARYVLECEARGTQATRASAIKHVRARLGDSYVGSIETTIDRMKLFAPGLVGDERRLRPSTLPKSSNAPERASSSKDFFTELKELRAARNRS